MATDRYAAERAVLGDADCARSAAYDLCCLLGGQADENAQHNDFFGPLT